MYDTILVPTDGSDRSLTALRHALELAEAVDASVHALYVVDTETSWLTVSKSEVRDTLRNVGEDAARQALSSAERLAADFDVSLVTATREGSPDEAIIDYVTSEDIDLVVMATHGRQGIGRRLLGSVTERVVRDAPVPVTTISESAGDG
ncbi:universal stress protein [Salinirubrum litoreum]|uniref:Universal stress protein n=1 Tax=Salinirubrum litoreum TaxID=1126234 RepID=A0ABD5RFG2_9EURY|nr:universal stress protein [Salinirubrum litoreum]